MKMDIPCTTCVLNQLIRTLNILNISKEKKIEIIRFALKTLYEDEWEEPSVVYFKIYKFLRKTSGVDDPYRDEKIYCDTKLMEYLNFIRKLVDEADDPLYMALKLSISGNMIDFGALEEVDVRNAIRDAISKRLTIDDYQIFKRKLLNASKMMIILDNSGESVFDKIFIEELLGNSNIEKVYVVVRKEPFINDVTLKDVLRIKFDEIDGVEFMEMPVDYNEYKDFIRNNVFDKWFKSMDIVISKGQGNFEIFEEYRGVFFGLVTKCEVIAKCFGTSIGDLVFIYKD